MSFAASVLINHGDPDLAVRMSLQRFSASL